MNFYLNVFTVAGKKSSGENDVLGKMTTQHPSAKKSKPKSRKRALPQSDSAIHVKSKYCKTEITQRKSVTDESKCKQDEINILVNVDVHAEMNASVSDDHTIETPTKSQITTYSKRFILEMPEQKRISDHADDWKTVSKNVDQQSTTDNKLNQTEDESICEIFTECNGTTQDALILNSSRLYTEINTMKENDGHSSCAKQSSTAHEIRSTPVTVAPIDLSEAQFIVAAPDYICECEVEDTSEIEEMCIQNDSFDNMKYDGSYSSKIEETVKYSPTYKSDELCPDVDKFVRNTQG